jgi:purine-binding chemotaxis protein CheW
MDRRCIEFEIPGLFEGTLALPIQRVVAISSPLTVTPVPLSPPFVKGICDWGQQVVPVLDLACLLGLCQLSAPGSALLLARMIFNQREELIAWWIQAGAHQIDLPAEIPLDDSTLTSPLIYGIGRLNDHRVLLLDMDQLPPELLIV